MYETFHISALIMTYFDPDVKRSGFFFNYFLPSAGRRFPESVPGVFNQIFLKGAGPGSDFGCKPVAGGGRFFGIQRRVA